MVRIRGLHPLDSGSTPLCDTTYADLIQTDECVPEEHRRLDRYQQSAPNLILDARVAAGKSVKCFLRLSRCVVSNVLCSYSPTGRGNGFRFRSVSVRIRMRVPKFNAQLDQLAESRDLKSL